MDYTSITAVIGRIVDIEERIGLHRKPIAKGFHEMLTGEYGKSTSPKIHKKGRIEPQVKMQEVINPQNTMAIIEQASKKHHVDPKLVSAVAQTESAFNQNAISATGAIGVMQLMPDTARELGVNPYNLKENIEGGTKYLKNMLDTFNGDVTKAVAAYNAGPNAVKAYQSVPPYKETQEYVEKVLDIYR